MARVMHFSNSMKTLNMLFAVILLSAGLSQASEILVMAPSSATDIMTECADLYAQQCTDKLRFNFASSGTMARQLSSGVPADLFISANTQWMDYLEADDKIIKDSRQSLFSNRMVLIVHNSSPLREIDAGNLNLPQLIKIRAACGDMASVPCGMYTKEIFDKYGWQEALKDKLVFGSNVRQVLFFVERNEVEAGLVYLTDAKISKAVRIITIFPSDSHTPIVYPAAVCTASTNRTGAHKFLSFLASQEAIRIFTKYGFESPPNP